MDTVINNIFPTPIYISNLNRKFSKKELSFFKKTKLNYVKNIGNITSKDNYILNNVILKKLKNEINLSIKDYFDKIISSKDDVKPYITQSWLNYTEVNQYHHKHDHPNSIVSGVLYINSDKKFDKIIFLKKEYKQIKFNVKEWNQFNSETWFFNVESGQIILFPSSLTHMVETKEGDNTRISLAFNVFFKGEIGSNIELTELSI
jgi:uncharacterized protein (TIGR02466 family)